MISDEKSQENVEVASRCMWISKSAGQRNLKPNSCGEDSWFDTWAKKSKALKVGGTSICERWTEVCNLKWGGFLDSV